MRKQKINCPFGKHPLPGVSEDVLCEARTVLGGQGHASSVLGRCDSVQISYISPRNLKFVF